MTTITNTATPTNPDQARQRDLQAMLLDHQREMQAVLQRRLRLAPADDPGDGLDDTEHAEAGTQQHIEVALIQMKGDTLSRVREALARLDAGEYGRCTECRGDISEKRLRALLFAVRCTACERAREQRAATERRDALPRSVRSIFADSVWA